MTLPTPGIQLEDPTRYDDFDPLFGDTLSEIYRSIARNTNHGQWVSQALLLRDVRDQFSGQLNTSTFEGVIGRLAAAGWIIRGRSGKYKGQVKVSPAGRKLRSELRP